jgi:2'-5' RNA ligase
VNGTIRAFVAIHPPEELLASLRALQKQLQPDLPMHAVRWTPPEQLHLTMKFLGNIPIANLSDLEAALKTVGEHSASLLLRAAGLGCFPSPGKPRVIWVGLEGDLAQLQTLQSQIDAALQPWCERNEERSFRPHLTIGRVRETSARDARHIRERVTAAVIPKLGEWRVGQINLLRSELSPQGAEHTVLASVPLR